MTKRTISQNNALHLYCDLRAEDLNDKGYTVQDLSGEVTVPATKSLVEEHLFKPQNPDTEISSDHRECFEFMANTFNEFGIDFRMLLHPDQSVKWGTILVKECIWKPVQKMVVGKDRTRDLAKRGEIERVHEQLEGNEQKGIVGFIPQKFPDAEYIEFPNREFDDQEDYPDASDYSVDQIPF